MKRILIANRGEIAQRVARTATRMGIEFVAVYSDADAAMPLVRDAARAVHLGASPPMQSYLDGRKLIEAALSTQCDAIHPGYGFLSENAAFAQAVTEAGLVFIGPRAETIAALGDKAGAKRLMREAGVPTVPGSTQASEDPAQITALALEMGFPVLLKPSAGGGGKGMQIVRDAEALRDAVEQGIRLARANFKDGRLLVERYVENPRHIEVQVFGDRHGQVVHLFERECSLQRRHQKVVEEAPAWGLDPAVRAALLEAAVRGARALGYVNAGTFEFIVGAEGDFYFLEVNTRLQVEHPVSEAITGLDLVEWQLRVAAGEALPLSQAQIACAGHAIECRVYAEDASQDFRPAPGRIAALRWPQAVRVETGIEEGSEIPPFYDPMIAKLVVQGGDRAAALAEARRAIAQSVILGLTTNLGYLDHVLADPRVASNDIHTHYLDQQLAAYRAGLDRDAAVACAAAVELASRSPARPRWPWDAGRSTAMLDRTSLGTDAGLGVFHFDAEDGARCAVLLEADVQRPLLQVGDRSLQVRCDALGDGSGWQGTVDGHPWSALRVGDALELLVRGERAVLRLAASRDASHADAGNAAAAPMPGVVVALPVGVGDTVRRGDTLAVVEAMKMENRVTSRCDGTVAAVHVRMGDNVRAGEVLVDVTPA